MCTSAVGSSALQTKKLLSLLIQFYASSTWVGFTNAKDRQKIRAFINCSMHAGVYASCELNDFDALSTSADNELFQQVLTNPDHVLTHFSLSCMHNSDLQSYMFDIEHIR